MLTKVRGLFVAACCIAGLLGCVSADAYRAKEWEVQALVTANKDMREQNKSLRDENTGLETRSGEMKKENEGLKDRIEKQSEEILSLKYRAEALQKDGEAVRARVETLNTKIAELNNENQRLASMNRPENLLRTLGERLAELQKQVEMLWGENAKLKNEQVIAWSEKKKASEAEGEKTIKPASEKLQAVVVPGGQKTEDSKPDQQVQQWRERAPLSEDREKPSNKP